MPGRYRERPYIPAKDPLAAIPPSRHPFQFWVLFACALGGAGNLFAEGSQVLNELPLAFHEVWAITLMAASIAAIVAAWWPDRITGLLLERLGLLSIGLVCPAYALLLVTFSEPPSAVAVSAALTASVGVAAIWRGGIHVTRELHILRTYVERTGIRSRDEDEEGSR